MTESSRYPSSTHCRATAGPRPRRRAGHDGWRRVTADRRVVHQASSSTAWRRQRRGVLDEVRTGDQPGWRERARSRARTSRRNGGLTRNGSTASRTREPRSSRRGHDGRTADRCRSTSSRRVGARTSLATTTRSAWSTATSTCSRGGCRQSRRRVSSGEAFDGEKGRSDLRSGPEALDALEQLKPLFHPDPAIVDGALENQFTAGPTRGRGRRGSVVRDRTMRSCGTSPKPPAQGGRRSRAAAATPPSCSRTCSQTHICVNPDIASNRLVREFVERHCGATGLRHVEEPAPIRDCLASSAEGRRVDLALIDGNHSHPFPLLDFHYMDQMLTREGRPAGRQHRDPGGPGTDRVPRVSKRAYRLERLIDNCAVYRKVGDRQFGWKSQTIRRPPADVRPAVQ